MNIAWETAELRLRSPFKIATTGADAARQTVLARVGEGIGEAAPRPYYGESIESVHNDLRRAKNALKDLPDDAPIEAAMRRFQGGSAARCALETALWDSLGRRLDAPLWRIWGTDPAAMQGTSYTIGLDSLPRMREKLKTADPYPAVKVKLGGPEDLEIVRALRSETDKTVRVDANTAWAPEAAAELCVQLAELGVELVEQPVAADDIDGMRFVKERSPIPIIADESCRSARDVARLAGAADGVNVKLSKCGGPTEALTALRLARSYGMLTMVGCMIESSAGISAMAQMAPLADYVDLDGHLLIENDPFEPLPMENGRILLNDRPGNGLRLQKTAAEQA